MSETAQQAENLVTIEIDGVELQAPKGSMIIEAADKAGIGIPRFCYHKRLSIAANCRMCLVDVEKAPKPLPACATPVMDGMKVYTESRRALSAQQNVMEFLLINHPLDCPICDQGGECELQDVSMGFGRSVSRFVERKRVVKDENLGPLISTEMTRCIHCTRCVRFLREVAGSNELGGIGRGETMKISTFIGRSVDSELSGNIIDLCPVGALTNKPFRFAARAWELRSRSSVAPHDCVGSNIHYHLRHGRILRAVPREHDSINESWLADRDRWGYLGLYSDDRATEPMIRGADGEWQSATWDEALDRAAEILRSVAGDELGVLLSPRATNEELYLAQKVARSLGSHNVDHRLRQLDFSDQASLPARPQLGLTMTELDHARAILLLGSNIRHDQPLLGHRVRKAWLRGGKVAALNPLDFNFHFSCAAESVVLPDAMVGTLAGLAARAGVKLPKKLAPAGDAEFVDAVSELLSVEGRKVILFGNHAAGHPQAATLRWLARALADATGAVFCEVPASANGVGAWTAGAVPHRAAGGRPTEVGLNVRQMVEQPRRAYLTWDFEPGADTVYGPTMNAALGQAAVVHCGAFVTDEIRAFADVILPLAVAPEVDGSLTNADGLIQTFEGAGDAPGDARAGWKVLRVLGNALGVDGFDFTRGEQVRAEIAEALSAAPADIGGDWQPEYDAVRADGDLQIIADLPIYASDGLVRRSAPLQATVLGERPHLGLSPADAERLALSEGDERTVLVGNQRLTLPVRVDDRVPAGGARLPLGLVAFDAAAAMLSLEEG